MYVRVTRGRFDPAKADELARLSPAISAAIRHLPGCQSNQIGLDRAGGRNISISVFDTAEHSRFSRETVGAALAPALALDEVFHRIAQGSVLAVQAGEGCRVP